MAKNLQNIGGGTTKERREFLKKAGKFGITVPMAALLLSVSSKPSNAGTSYNPTPTNS